MSIKPTLGECVWLWRRRRNLTLVQASQQWGIQRRDLVACEADRKLPPDNLRRRVEKLVPAPEEELRLLRRRSGLGSRGAAAAYGISHVSLLRLEETGDEGLKRWYLARHRGRRNVDCPLEAASP